MLGDAVHQALSIVGATPERVSRWVGQDCCCEERRERLNQLDRWARRIISGRIEQAASYLEQILTS